MACRTTLPVSVVDHAEVNDGEADLSLAQKIVLKHDLVIAGVEFIPENGGGVGVRLRKVES